MMTLDQSKIASAMQKEISADIASGRVGGAAVLVKQHGKDIHRACFGQSAPGKALEQNALFRLASMTKPITAAAIIKQIERGLLSLDDPLEKFIPAYGEMEIGRMREDGQLEIVGKAQRKITILHLLTHASGIGCEPLTAYVEGLYTPERESDLCSVTQTYADYPLSFEPGTAQAYSGRVGFDLLARVVELTADMPYDEYLRQEIFTPLCMEDATFTPSGAQWERMVCLHDYKDGQSLFHPLDRAHVFGPLPLGYFCGGAGLVATLSDYEKFASMLLRGGKAESGEQLLREQSVRLMRTPAISEAIMPGNQRWGLGMRVITDASYPMLPTNAYGWSGAYGTHFWLDPDNDTIGIYMKNSHYDGGSGAMTAVHFEKNVYLPQ
jgi:CubicO group peptidase (beta-lactamase class C family)